MANHYVPVLWSLRKKRYDLVLWGFITCYLAAFGILGFLFYPEATAEILMIRATGSLAFLMLHLILMIGPLARLDSRFLPVLYNRRHFGVIMFGIALIHGLLSLFQFHALGNLNPFLSLFTSNLQYTSLVHFPFQTLGFFALLILFLMAATSHDFWLHNLSPRIWKSLHMLVYLAYALLLMHVMLGTVQFEASPMLLCLLVIGLVLLTSLHLLAGFRERKRDKASGILQADGFVEVGSFHEIPDNGAVTIGAGGERIAIFRYGNKVSAVSNVCRHQGGPLGEGRIVDGCITCPWHGYQYAPQNGCSPPPFTEKVETFDLKLIGDTVLVDPKPWPPGTERIPATFNPDRIL
jgi:nitrite reductase/ring-hydroxylating ferredoxin subunit/DMSO/TMAO reductase YedYZ heme-binding membrane subunit